MPPFGQSGAHDPRLLKHFQDYEVYLKKARREFEVRWNSPFSANAELGEFTIMRTLGSGAFGRVCLAKHRKKETVFAMKMLDKKHIVKTKQIDHVHSEIRIMDAINFDFFVKLHFYFKNNCYLFVMMPFIGGGEMFGHLRKLRKFDESLAKFYAAQVVLAFEYIHYIGIVYRDLKPENILMETDGYIKITDFGFCKRIDEQRTWTLCGTPEYLAPEIIMSQGYNRSVDWWSLGILIYEMTAGYPPFYAKDPMRLYDKIVCGKYSYPQHFSKYLQHLLLNMIVVDRTKRLQEHAGHFFVHTLKANEVFLIELSQKLYGEDEDVKYLDQCCFPGERTCQGNNFSTLFGVLKNGSKDVKCHDWFKSVDWDGILLKKIKPTYKPQQTSAEDTSNFEEQDEQPIRTNSVEEFPAEFATIQVKK